MKIVKARQNSLGRVGSSSDQNLHNNNACNIPNSPVTAASPVAGASGSVNTN